MCEVDKMLYRKVQKDIEKWLNDGHDALLITGARQVGKSFLIRETLKKNKINYVEFHFIQNPNGYPFFLPSLFRRRSRLFCGKKARLFPLLRQR